MRTLDLMDGRWVLPGESVELAQSASGLLPLGTRAHLPAVGGEWERIPDESPDQEAREAAEAAVDAWYGRSIFAQGAESDDKARQGTERAHDQVAEDWVRQFGFGA